MDPVGSILRRSPPASPKRNSRSPSPLTAQHNTVTFAPNTADLSFELDGVNDGTRASPALSEGGSNLSDGADSEGSTSWQKKVRTMLLEGLSTENKHTFRRHDSNASVLRSVFSLLYAVICYWLVNASCTKRNRQPDFITGFERLLKSHN